MKKLRKKFSVYNEFWKFWYTIIEIKYFVEAMKIYAIYKIVIAKVFKAKESKSAHCTLQWKTTMRNQ